MADYSELKQNIASVIKSNNRREITGQILQNVLNQMVGSLGENYQLAGFAEPTTNPQQPDQTLFYIAEQAGVYTNFDNITLGDGLSFLMWKNSEWTSHTIGVATHSWVDSNYVSKAFLRQIFRVYDADGFEILPNDTTSIADNIKAMVGLWTNEYLSALGLGDDGQTGAQYLTQLGDVDIDSTTLADGQVLVYDNGLWVNGQAGGVDMSVVWAALAGNTNEQINASHLTTALTGYVTSSSLSTTLADYVTTTALNTALASYASQSWVSQNYVSIAFLNRILRAYDSTDTQVQPNDTTTAIDNLKAMVGLWTEQYLSALGQGNDGGGGGYITTLGQLEDVLLTTPSVGQALVYAEVESGVYKWVNGTAGVDMSSVWTALAGSTNEQIAQSHLTTALSGYVTTGGLSTTLTDYVTATALSTTLADYVTATSLSTTLASYATQQWVGQNYISIAFFNRLFAAYDSNNVIINPNDTTTAVDNIKALVGLWTQQYISALGQGSDGGVVTSLANLTDVDLGSTINNNDVLTYDSSTNKWTNKPAQGGSTVAALGDLTDVGISSLADKDILQYDYTNNVWKNVTLATALTGYATTSQLANYLPLSGGTISGGIVPNGDSTIDLGSASYKYHYLYVHRLVRVQSLAKGDTYNSYQLTLPDKSGTIAITSDIPTNNNQLTNGAGYITGITSSMVTSALGYTPISSSGSCAYATSAGSVDWGNISSKPTTLSGYGITDGLYSAQVSENQENVTWAQSQAASTPRAFIYNTSSTEWSYLFGFRNNSAFGAVLKMGYNDRYLRILRCFNGSWQSSDWEKIYAGYADSAGSVDWSNVSGRPTAVSSFTNDAGYYKSGDSPSFSSLSTSGGIYMAGYLYMKDSGGNWVSTIDKYGSNPIFGWGQGQNGTSVYYTGRIVYINGGASWNVSNGLVITSDNNIAIGRDSAYTKFDLNGGQAKFGYGTGSGSIDESTICIHVGTASTRSGSGYLGGIAFNQLLNYGGADGYRGAPQAWIGIRIYDTPGSERANLVFATKEGTSNPENPIERMCIDPFGKVGIGATSPSYKLHVAGDIYATGGVTSLSDIRKKDVISYELPLNVEQIANAPTIKFLWKDKREEGEQVGTIAQYWQDVLPESIKDKSGELSMSYGVAALISSITNARKIVDHDRLLREQAAKISELENKCSLLEREVERLKCA